MADIAARAYFGSHWGALRSMKQEKLVEFQPMMLMWPVHRDEIITLAGYDATAAADEQPNVAGEEQVDEYDEFDLAMMPEIPRLATKSRQSMCVGPREVGLETTTSGS